MLDKQEIKYLKKEIKLKEKMNNDVRDAMAMQRTVFANERTLMAYLRTAMAIVAGGFIAIKFSDDLYLEIGGIILILIGLAVGSYSFYRFLQKQKVLEHHSGRYSPTSHHHESLHKHKHKDRTDTV
jgi:putative membrane protein